MGFTASEDLRIPSFPSIFFYFLLLFASSCYAAYHFTGTGG
jgi:hypothetical protein